MGPAISAIFESQGLQCQYTATAQMCYNPQGSDVDRYTCTALVKSWVFMMNRWLYQTGKNRIVDGYIIYDEFVAMYACMARYLGRPLTQLRFNYQQMRYEQFLKTAVFTGVSLTRWAGSFISLRCVPLWDELQLFTAIWQRYHRR